MNKELIEFAMKLYPNKFTFDSLIGLISNIPNCSVAMYEVVYNDSKQPIDLRAFFVNNDYLKKIKKDVGNVIGKLFSEIAPTDAPYIPFYIKVAQGGEPQSMESYSDETSLYLHIVVFSPGHDQVCTLIFNRTQFVATERETAEKEQKIETMFNTMPIGICYCQIIYDKNNEPVDLHAILVNEAFEIFEGIVVNTIQGKVFYKIYPNEPKDDMYRYDESLKKNEKISYIKDGAAGRMIEVICYPQSNNQLIVIERDVTARVKAEQKARNLAAIVSMADAGFIVKDKNGVVTEWNIGAENIFGYKQDEIIGKTTHYYAPEESYDGIDKIEERLEKGEHIAHVEVVRKHKDGRLVDCSASYTPIFDSKGNFDGSVAIFHDITSGKLAEKKARDLAAIVSVSDAGIVVKDASCNILEWNIGAENILGYSYEEIIGKNTKYYVPEEEYDEIDSIKECLLRGEHTTHVEVVRKHKSGKLVDCAASYTPVFDDNGIFTGSVAVFHDISDKKQMELALRKANLEAEEKHKIILDSIEYSSKIQKNLLPWNTLLEQAFSDYSVIWEPRDIVGGDIYWLKSFEDGVLLSVCDCTGHGTPGALLTMLVASTFDTIVNEASYKDTAQIMYLLDRQISAVLNVKVSDERTYDGIKDGCDLVVLYLAKDGGVTLSSGNMHVFICDGNEVTQIKGQRLFVGEGSIKSKDDVKVITISANTDNKFYIASDGLYDQLGGEPRRPFGYKMFKQIILENHNEKQAVISEKIWEAFECHRGNQARRDDVELITFKP